MTRNIPVHEPMHHLPERNKKVTEIPYADLTEISYAILLVKVIFN